MLDSAMIVRCAAVRCLTVVLCLAGAEGATGDQYRLDWHSTNCGGTVVSADGAFELIATIGQAQVGMLEGGEFTLSVGFEIAYGTGDADGDGDVDLNDYAAWDACMRGPYELSCHVFDMDADGDVDLYDFANFLLAIAADAS